jgi:GNAT superfamily N-acetyltransferase
MSVSVRAANRTDRETCVRPSVAQLTEHNLPADPARAGDGVELAFTPHSLIWLLLAELDGVAVGILLANQIVSVGKGGYTLWVEELYVVPAARRRLVATAFLEHLLTEGRRRRVRAVELEVHRGVHPLSSAGISRRISPTDDLGPELRLCWDHRGFGSHRRSACP